MTKKELMAKGLFVEKLGHMLDAGVPLVRSLRTLKDEIDAPAIQKAIDDTLDLFDNCAGDDEKIEPNQIAELLAPQGLFKNSERTMIKIGFEVGRPDRMFLTIAKWVDRELAAAE